MSYNRYKTFFVSLTTCALLGYSGVALAQDEGDEDPSSNGTICDVGSIAFADKADAKCTCSSPNASNAYKACLTKLVAPALKALKPAINYAKSSTDETLADCKMTLQAIVDDYVWYCENPDDGGDTGDGGDDGGGDSDPAE